MRRPVIPEPAPTDTAWWRDLKYWCRDVVCALDRSVLSGDGRTIAVSGNVISAITPDPYPFRVDRVTKTSVRVHTGDWWRNGNKVTLTCDPGESYKTLSSLTGGPYYVTLALSRTGTPSTHHAALEPDTLTVTAETSEPTSDTYNTRMVIATLTCTSSVLNEPDQIWTGGDIDDTTMLPDSHGDGVVTVTGKSLDYDAHGALEQYGWHDAADAGTIADTDLITFQDVSETALPQNYISFASLVTAIIGAIDDGDLLDSIIETWFLETGEHANLTDIDADTGPHYQVDHLTHFCNAAATNGEVPADATYARNYCYSLGNSDGDLTIDLDNTALYAAAGTECKLDWGAGKTYMWVGGSPLERIDWTGGVLYGEVGYVQHNSVYWAGGQLQYGTAVMLDWWTSAGTQVDIGTTGAHKDLKVWGGVTVADVLDIDATDGLTVGGATPYSSESEHQIALPAGGYVRLKFKHGIAFAYS